MMNLLRGIAGICLAPLLGGVPVAFCAEAPIAVPAVSAAAAPAKEGQRYLFVVDTSRSMRSRLAATLDLMQHLLTTGMDGRLHRDDTIGLWTFGSSLQTGAFPLQSWSPEKRRGIAIAITTHLQGMPFTGSTAIRKPVAAALEILRESDAITILLITDGEQSIKGTPFDVEINTAFQREAKPMRAAGLPFAVFLTGHGGKATAYAVNSVFQPLAYPKDETAEVVPVPKPAEPEIKSPQPPVTPKVPPTVESKPAETTAAVTPVAETKDPVSAPTATPEAAPTQPIAVIPANTPLVVNEKGSVVLPQPVITAPTEPAPTPAASEPKSEPAKTTEPVAEVKPATAPIQETQPVAQPAVTFTTPPFQPTPATVPGAAPTKPVEVVVVVTQIVATLPPVLPTPTTNTRPTSIPTESSVAASSTGMLVFAPAPVALQAKSAEADPVTNSPARLIAAIPPEATYSSRTLLIAAFTLLVVAAGLMLLLFRRRAPAGASIISRSMDHNKH